MWWNKGKKYRSYKKIKGVQRINKIKNFKRMLFRFKLHLITNEKGEIISFYLSKAKKMIMIYPLFQNLQKD
jgi:hypothetical protein